MSKTKLSDPKTLADAVMLRTLQRAHDGTLRRGEAERCATTMPGFQELVRSEPER